MIPICSCWTLALFLTGPPEIAPAAEPASLVEVADSPSAWTRRTVRFVVQLDALEHDWDPGMTRFAPDEWTAVRAWADEQYTWDPDVFERPHRRLFVTRDSGLEDELAAAPRFARFEVQATCHAAFGGDAWLELERLVPLEGAVGEGTLVCVNRAADALRQGRYEIALDQLERAAVGPLPDHAKVRLEELAAEFRLEQVRAKERRTAADPTRGRVRR